MITITKTNGEYIIDQVYGNSSTANEIVFDDNSTIRFEEGGEIINCSITGQNLIVIPNGTDVAFDVCDFTGATIVNSEVYATNFGFVDDMGVEDDVLDIQQYDNDKPHFIFYLPKIKKRNGTNNHSKWNAIGTFLSNSDGVKIIFNGKFYSYNPQAGHNSVSIRNATHLMITGENRSSTIMMGLRLINCHDGIVIKCLNIVGLHLPHRFPPITNKTTKTGYFVYFCNTAGQVIEKEIKKEDIFNVGDGMYSIGLLDDAIVIDVEGIGPHCYSKDILIKNVHCEMRQNGIHIGERTFKKVIRDVRIYNCSADHMLFQPFGFHASHCYVYNFKAHYCLQGIDISTRSDNILVENGHFTGCATGPKQESMSMFRTYSHNNKIVGCTFEISDGIIGEDFDTLGYEGLFLADGSNYILHMNAGADGDEFLVKDCTFTIRKFRKFVPFKCFSNFIKFDNVTFNIETGSPGIYTNAVTYFSKSTNSVIKFTNADEIFAIYGYTPHSPCIRFANTKINILNPKMSVAYLFGPHVPDITLRYSLESNSSLVIISSFTQSSDNFAFKKIVDTNFGCSVVNVSEFDPQTFKPKYKIQFKDIINNATYVNSDWEEEMIDGTCNH